MNFRPLPKPTPSLLYVRDSQGVYRIVGKLEEMSTTGHGRTQMRISANVLPEPRYLGLLGPAEKPQLAVQIAGKARSTFAADVNSLRLLTPMLGGRFQIDLDMNLLGAVALAWRDFS